MWKAKGHFCKEKCKYIWGQERYWGGGEVNWGLGKILGDGAYAPLCPRGATTSYSQCNIGTINNNKGK